MDFGAATYVAGLLAGALSTLAPCVLPLLPVGVAAAIARNRWAPAALTAGFGAAFAAVSVFVAAVGYSIGLDGAWFRRTAGILLVFFGGMLMSAQPRERLAASAENLSAASRWLLARLKAPGWGTELALGLLLGVVWVPFAGPTLGAASFLAAQREALPQITALLFVFGLGAAALLVALGVISRAFLSEARTPALGNALLGALLVATGVLVLTGTDRRIEASAIERWPVVLIDLATAL